MTIVSRLASNHNISDMSSDSRYHEHDHIFDQLLSHYKLGKLPSTRDDLLQLLYKVYIDFHGIKEKNGHISKEIQHLVHDNMKLSQELVRFKESKQEELDKIFNNYQHILQTKDQLVHFVEEKINHVQNDISVDPIDEGQSSLHLDTSLSISEKHLPNLTEIQDNDQIIRSLEYKLKLRDEQISRLQELLSRVYSHTTYTNILPSESYVSKEEEIRDLRDIVQEYQHELKIQEDIIKDHEKQLATIQSSSLSEEIEKLKEENRQLKQAQDKLFHNILNSNQQPSPNHLTETAQKLALKRKEQEEEMKKSRERQQEDMKQIVQYRQTVQTLQQQCKDLTHQLDHSNQTIQLLQQQLALSPADESVKTQQILNAYDSLHVVLRDMREQYTEMLQHIQEQDKFIDHLRDELSSSQQEQIAIQQKFEQTEKLLNDERIVMSRLRQDLSNMANVKDRVEHLLNSKDQQIALLERKSKKQQQEFQQLAQSYQRVMRDVDEQKHLLRNANDIMNDSEKDLSIDVLDSRFRELLDRLEQKDAQIQELKYEQERLENTLLDISTSTLSSKEYHESNLFEQMERLKHQVKNQQNRLNKMQEKLTEKENQLGTLKNEHSTLHFLKSENEALKKVLYNMESAMMLPSSIAEHSTTDQISDIHGRASPSPIKRTSSNDDKSGKNHIDNNMDDSILNDWKNHSQNILTHLQEMATDHPKDAGNGANSLSKIYHMMEEHNIALRQYVQQLRQDLEKAKLFSEREDKQDITF